jgi:hypothetical protein
LFYKVGEDNNIKGYMDAGCLSNSYKRKSFSWNKEQQYLGNQRSTTLQQHPQTILNL